jgi:GNAT superfamily N-acetyltransferase
MPVPLSHDTIMRIERAAVCAWPALETARIDGWLWRYTGGGSQRANSVSALDFTGSDAEAAIDEAERLYAARGADPMFQICDADAPADLDARLARRGYRLQEPCTALAKEIAPRELPTDVEVGSSASEAWLSVYLPGISESRRHIAPKILARVPAPRAFFLLRGNGEPMSAALGVVAHGVVIAECVATRAAFRCRGGSALIMTALEAWGAKMGARIAALQAVTANAPAQALYAKLDYRPVGGYHYRVLNSRGVHAHARQSQPPGSRLVEDPGTDR